jgi:hypothetical protein
VPHAAPVQPVPESAQVTPLFCGSFWTVAVNVCVCPVITDWLAGATVTLTGGGSAVMVIVALALFVGSVTDVAVNVTVSGPGTVIGAV